MNQPNPFGAGGFKLNGTLHSAQPNTPPQSPKPPKRPGPTKSSPVIPPPTAKITVTAAKTARRSTRF